PADNPEVALLIIVDTPKKSIYGGVNAAPIFKEIATRWMQLNAHSLDNIATISNKDSILTPYLIGMDYNYLDDIEDYYNIDIISNKENGIVFYQTPKYSE